MRQASQLVLLLIVVLCLPSGAQIPEKFTNLKVLPKEITRPELMKHMKGFALGLGVRCSSCHVGEENKPLSTYDFASDEKPMKRNARIMLAMVKEINEKSVSKLELGDKPVTVTCYTCHRGSKEPASEAPLPAAPPMPATPPVPPKQ